MLRRHFIINTEVHIYNIPNNEIWYTSSDGNIVIPYMTDAFGVNIISNTYEYGRGIIKFDGNVLSIGKGAFSYCTSLTSIAIPNSVTSIGVGAFYYCHFITSITITNNVKNIRYWAFYKCSTLTSIRIPNRITSIEYAAFMHCINLKYIKYNGYRKDWYKIQLGSQWNHNVPCEIIQCLDGDIYLNEYFYTMIGEFD